MIRAVIVGTTGNGHRHFIGIMISHYHHVGTRFGCTIRTMGTKRSRFMEITLCSQRTIHLIRRNLMVANSFTPSRIAIFIFPCHPSATGSIQQILCTQNVGHKEQLRIFNAAVHMALGSEIHDIIKLILAKQTVSQLTVTNITFKKNATVIIYIICNSSQITGIRQRIEYYHTDIIVFCQNVLQVIRPDKTGSPSHKIGFHIIFIF